MRPIKSTCDTQMKFRVPPDLKAQLETSADRHMRSLRGEIIWRLAQSFDDHPVPASDTPIDMEA